MHVGLFTPTWHLQTHPNGIETYVHWMREELVRQGHRVSIFTPSAKSPGPDVHVVAPSRFLQLRRWLRSRFRPMDSYLFGWGESIAAAIQRVHRRDPFDIVEMEESFGWFAEVGRALSIPVVVKLHGPAFMTLMAHEMSSPVGKARISKEGEALRRLSFLTAPSKRTLDATLARYDLRPQISRHIVNPLTLPQSAPVWDLARCDPHRLLFVGRFDQLKGGDIVLKAFAKLLVSRPALTLVFVGRDGTIPGEDGRSLNLAGMRRALFPGDLANHVVYLGGLQPNEIYALRAQAFATIVASRWENQSYTLLEAMLQGCPVISSDAGGQGEVIQHGVNGLLSVVADPGDLCEKLENLLDNIEQAARLGKAAREYVLQHHAPSAVVSKTLDFYRQAMAAGDIKGGIKTPASRLPK